MDPDSAYGGWRQLADERADLVVALDYSRLTSLTRLLRRTATRIVDQQEICNGNHETWRTVFARGSLVVWHFTSFRRKRIEMRAWAAAGVRTFCGSAEATPPGRSSIEAETARQASRQLETGGGSRTASMTSCAMANLGDSPRAWEPRCG